MAPNPSIIMRNRKEPTRKPVRKPTRPRPCDDLFEKQDDDVRRCSLESSDQSFDSFYSNSNISTDSRSSVAALDLECDESMDEISNPLMEFEQLRPNPFGSMGKAEGASRRHPRWSMTSDDYLDTMLERESMYFCDANLVLQYQPHITPVMRAILMDWMMEACSEFMFKRETFHNAVSHVDRFLSRYPSVMKEHFQLVGLVAIYIAAKSEEIYTPRITDFAKAAQNTYTVEEIRHMERLMLQRLSWLMFPVTVYTWVSWLMSQWDSFCLFHFHYLPNNDLKEIELLPPHECNLQKALYESRMILFKEKTRTAYDRFRETLQIMDAAVLDHNLLQMTPRLASSGLLYLMLNKFFYESDYSLIFYTGESSFPENSLSLAFGSDSYGYTDEASQRLQEGSCKVKELVCNFLSMAADIADLGSLEFSINFFEGFLPMTRDYTLPIVYRFLKENRDSLVREDLLSFQTYNPNSREFVCTR
mmetsp:Transcript_29044/g.51963  ORF Transcript_29044/g.51963 Transcript_29044/m.51963 type:complete len:475 (-) Transcript_29044:1657-3081(-)